MGLNIKGYEIGSGKPLCCVPIVETDAQAIQSQAARLAKEGTEMVEWRLDWFDSLTDNRQVLAVLKNLSHILTHVIFLVTYRSKQQGGEGTLRTVDMQELLLAIADSGYADLIDVEYYASGQPKELIRKLHEKHAFIISSHHDFQKTPSAQTMQEILEKMKDAEADIVKLAVMPQSLTDVTALLSATAQFHEQYPDKPVVTMSMGKLGLVSRVSGETFGSCVTFGADKEASAPGQMKKEELEDVLDRLHDTLSETQPNIYLIGFMGTGKSTVAHELRKQTGRRIVDTDAVLTARMGMTIPQMFETFGEDQFRRLESNLMEELSHTSNRIVSCGGGVILREENRVHMKESGTVVLLTAEPETILKRVKNDHNRPLLEGKKNVGAIAQMLSQRQANYDLAKDLSVTTDERRAAEIAQEIIEKIG